MFFDIMPVMVPGWMPAKKRAIDVRNWEVVVLDGHVVIRPKGSEG